MAGNTHPATAAEISATLAEATESELEALLERYADDPRAQVRRACGVATRRVARQRAERERVEGMYALMREMGGDGIVLGLDEVGRGSVAGPSRSAPWRCQTTPRCGASMTPSSSLPNAEAMACPVKIRQVAQAVGICHVPPARIDEVGMARALREAMLGAIADTGVEPDAVLIDGNPLHIHPKERTLVKGDARVACIAAASIVAKVTRDEMMVEYDEQFPGYHLASSKGYASPEHIEAIRERGLTPIHRVSFCQNFLETERLF